MSGSITIRLTTAVKQTTLRNKAVILNVILGALALLSLSLTLWQWLVARRFPLHRRAAKPVSLLNPVCDSPCGGVAPSSVQPSTLNPQPPVTLLKPVKGCDAVTESCLRSWFQQAYPGPVQLLFGVATADDPVCAIIHQLIRQFPDRDAQLVVCGPLVGANAKVSKLAELERLAKHEILMVSDADVRVPPDLLLNAIAPFAPGSTASTSALPGLVCCFYRLANPTTLAMQWEAIAINADFWSQVLQSQSLKPIDFALGAVMATRRPCLAEIGGFQALADCLADDYQLGHRITKRGHSIALCPVVVECWSDPMGWSEVWKHQLRWARTIRICQPLPYFFSLLSNPTLWPLVWLLARPAALSSACFVLCLIIRILTALDLQQRLAPPFTGGGRASSRAQTGSKDRAREDARPPTPSQAAWRYAWLIPLKDLLQAAIWLLAFLGNHIEWRGVRMRLRPDGTLERAQAGS